VAVDKTPTLDTFLKNTIVANLQNFAKAGAINFLRKPRWSRMASRS